MKFPACLLSAGFLLGTAVAETPATSLDARIEGMLAQMSDQEKIDQLFYKTDGNARLGIPQFTGSDGPHGIGNKSVGWSSFPVNLAMSATWDPALIQRVGKAIALEQQSRGRHRIAGPVLDLLHDPRNGRAPETIGEDPFLGGRIVEGFLRGMNETAVFATIKHYNLNTYEAGRRDNDYQTDPRSLVEFWGAHWRRAVQDGGAQSVMCAYNRVNGEKCAENRFLIRTVLRDLWGFQGYTMSDWDGFWSTEKAMAAELDFCEGAELYTKDLPGMLKDGRITPQQVNTAAGNILRTKILSGMIDGQPKILEAQTRDCPEHRALVYESGLKSMVLLKNQDAILPLDSKVKSVAIIGPNADTLPLDGHSSSAVIPSYTITPRQGLEALLGTERVSYAKGCEINSKDRSQFDEATRIAKASEVVVFVGGLDNTVEGEEHFIKGDRLTGSVDLPGVQNDLINALAAANPRMVLVVITGGQCAVAKVIENVKGLLYVTYPGQEGGRAIADLLLGKENPSGKLPVSIPKNDGQLPPRDHDFMNVVATGVGYRFYDQQKSQPEFAFGSGLSYTTFEYSNLRVSPDRTAAGQEVVVRVDVTNTGQRAGEEVAQLYLSTGEITPAAAMPVKQLRGFSKVLIEPGQTRQVTFTLTADEFYIYDPTTGSYRVPTGSYTARVGGASDRLPLSADFTLDPAPALPDLLVTHLRTVPAFPIVGEPVRFVATLLNRGTAPTSTAPVVSFRVNGKPISMAPELRQAIPAGGMTLVCGSVGEPWTATAGTYSLQAEADSARAIDETLESNNSATAVRSVRPKILSASKP
ncbi:glycoside hydrolase family 3 C-terminal domain-containing protein [bacterium]|nr:glycoside hydrolase family 3 C-terminal domain-containing protein [bacterium]